MQGTRLRSFRWVQLFCLHCMVLPAQVSAFVFHLPFSTMSCTVIASQGIVFGFLFKVRENSTTYPTPAPFTAMHTPTGRATSFCFCFPQQPCHKPSPGFHDELLHSICCPNSSWSPSSSTHVSHLSCAGSLT